MVRLSDRTCLANSQLFGVLYHAHRAPLKAGPLSEGGGVQERGGRQKSAKPVRSEK
jgi:hypothetical protein